MHTKPVFTSKGFKNKYISILKDLYAKDQTDFQTIYDDNDYEYRLEGWSLFRFEKNIRNAMSFDEAIRKIDTYLEKIDSLRDEDILSQSNKISRYFNAEMNY